MIKPPEAGSTDKLTLFFRRGSESRRAIYAYARRALNPRASLQGRRLALESAKQATFHIPRSSGFAIFPPSQFDEIGEVVTAARELLARYERERPSRRNQKPYRVNILKANELTSESPFIRFPLRQDIIAGIAEYLRVVPVLTGLQVWYSPPRSVEPQGSQLYHCDYDDTSQVKIFVHCNDVGPENGPLTVLSADTSSRVRKRLNYQYEGNNRLDDGQVFTVIREEDQHPIMGPAGTTGFVDVSRCLHYGSRVAADAEARLVVMIQLKTPFSFTLPRDFRRGAPFRYLDDPGLPKLARLVLGGD
jgi:hypothetical protein